MLNAHCAVGAQQEAGKKLSWEVGNRDTFGIDERLPSDVEVLDASSRIWNQDQSSMGWFPDGAHPDRIEGPPPPPLPSYGVPS